MSGNVVKLSSAQIVHPADRVREFIELAQTQIDALIPHPAWSELVWSVGNSFLTKGQNRGNRILAFVNRDATISNRQEVTGGALHPAIIGFAKAYCRYLHTTSPVTYENTRKRLDAVQLIEAAFRQLGLDPAIENLNVVVLNKAVELAREGVGAGRHYQFAIYVQQIHRFCVDRQFLNAPFQWKHGVRKPKDRTEEMGQEAKEWREKKLPSPEAFHALAHIYRNAETLKDRLFSAVCAICIAIPIRAHEVLQLRLDCEVTGKTKVPDSDEEIDTYGIRVWPGKGNPPQVKWVPTQMVDLVREAVGRLREMCSDARETCRWYEANPGKLWLPVEAERHRASVDLPLRDLWQILRHEPNGAKSGMVVTAHWARQLGIEGDNSGPRRSMVAVNLGSLTEKMLSRMPKDFPYYNGEPEQRYSDTLIVAFDNELTEHRPVRFVVAKATVQEFEQWLSGHDNGKKPAVFERWELVERDGSPIKITTHAFRHWLNTVAQFRGMSDLDIAKWSGRDVAQNKSYNHVSPEEMLSQIRQALDDGNAIGPMFDAAKVQGVNQPVDRREFTEAQIGSALLSDFGICVHDYSLLPCQSYGDCLGCSENVFVKGDQTHRAKIVKRLTITEKQLDDALVAMGANYYGADKWVETHRRSIERMKQMLAIHDDPSIPDGTIVNPAEVSQDNAVAMAIRDRNALGHEVNEGDLDDDPDLADIMAMMDED
ncbi:hypothetical protein [Rhizobium leguminosarum]|uniref:hypothetical protein n=1 Tax=Rhizobium leguminosarum TaxID=384 RepID=UPI00103BC5BC|nr:hypothetical protein [Rhizobium leguminosarum]TCA66469.1 hypothetical protein E0H41_03115 [Rhizobium leguminosarum bv. viciae]TCB30393.1 hypothetical protein E0J09_03115 [Rhizobium leguminosarum bv. viciae]